MSRETQSQVARLGRPTGRRAQRGVSLFEVVVAMAILAGVLVNVMGSLTRQARGMGAAAKLTAAETRAREMLERIERELTFAQGARPLAFLTDDFAVGATDALQVSATAGFPDQGILLLDRGTPWEERIAYTALDPVGLELTGLARAQQCTSASGHLEGSDVRWAALAEPIDDQSNPPAEQWDGTALELSGPTFFRGDGTGFTFRVPTDPTGGTDYLDGGEVTWGATVRGTPLASGWSALTFVPVMVLQEADAGLDINRDGDRADTFDVGRIHLRSWDAAAPGAGVTDVSLCPPMVLQEQCNWGGDLDGDGFDDPLFLFDPDLQKLHVRLSVAAGSVDTRTVVRRSDSVIFLVNAPAP